MPQKAGRHAHAGPIPSPQMGEGLRKLLDHVAAELAAEYVHLMEAAAHADGQSPSSPSDRKGSSA